MVGDHCSKANMCTSVTHLKEVRATLVSADAVHSHVELTSLAELGVEEIILS